MRSGFLPARVVHLHPTRACNLACAHCYSDSSPQARETLAPEVIIEALGRLRDEGYEIVSISGGEPLVYRPLDEIVAAAAGLGFRVHLITNGILLTRERLARLAPYCYLIGVSLDGAEETHNAVRGRHDAFRGAMRALTVLSQSDTEFGIICAVSSQSLGDIPWAFELARELGATLLHLRPLAPEGRARHMEASWTLTPEDCTRLFILAELLASYGSGAPPRVQVDLVHVPALAGARQQFALLDPTGTVERLSDAVNPLVIDASGRCWPFTYGIDDRLQLADITGGVTAELLRPSADQLARIAALLDASFESAPATGMEYLDWFTHLTAVSRRMPVAF